MFISRAGVYNDFVFVVLAACHPDGVAFWQAEMELVDVREGTTIIKKLTDVQSKRDMRESSEIANEEENSIRLDESVLVGYPHLCVRVELKHL